MAVRQVLFLTQFIGKVVEFEPGFPSGLVCNELPITTADSFVFIEVNFVGRSGTLFAK
jgi:hypothetical protein